MFDFTFSSPSGKKVDNKGKKPLESRSTKRRYNEEHSDAEEIDWESDDDETETTHKAISKSNIILMVDLVDKPVTVFNNGACH